MSLALFPRRRRTPKHTVKDLRSVSLSHNAMCRTYGYSFSLCHEADGWRLYADCPVAPGSDERTELDGIPVSEDDACGLLDVINAHGMIRRVAEYKAPRTDCEILDGETSLTSFGFTDKTSVTAAFADEELKTFFFRLAAEYGGKNTGNTPKGG